MAGFIGWIFIPKMGLEGYLMAKISFTYIPAFSYSAGAIKISEQPRSIICLLIASICLLPLCWSSNWTGISQQALLFITIMALISIYLPSKYHGRIAMKYSITHAIPVYAPAWQFGGPVLSVSRLCEALAQSQQQGKSAYNNTGLNEMDIEAINHPIIREGVEVTYYAAKNNTSTIQSQDLIDALPNALQGADLVHLSAIWQPLGIPIQRAAYSLNIPVLHSLRGALGPYSRRINGGRKSLIIGFKSVLGCKGRLEFM